MLPSMGFFKLGPSLPCWADTPIKKEIQTDKKKKSKRMDDFWTTAA
jgi:hypothetical protein